MLTDARRGEVLNARWQRLDLDSGVWAKLAAAFGQKRLNRVPSSGVTVQLLRALHSTVLADPRWVFPGDADGKPVHKIKRS